MRTNRTLLQCFLTRAWRCLPCSSPLQIFCCRSVYLFLCNAAASRDNFRVVCQLFSSTCPVSHYSQSIDNFLQKKSWKLKFSLNLFFFAKIFQNRCSKLQPQRYTTVPASFPKPCPHVEFGNCSILLLAMPAQPSQSVQESVLNKRKSFRGLKTAQCSPIRQIQKA